MANPKDRPQTEQEKWEQRRLEGAAYFMVSRFEGRGAYHKSGELPSLAAAEAYAAELGQSATGQQPIIYGVMENNVSIMVTERNRPQSR